MRFFRAGRICWRSPTGSPTINEQQLTAGNDQVVSLLLRFQTRLLVTLVAALVLGFGMAVFSTRRILKLEDQARLRYEEVADARGQLKDLSARLVQAQETERRALSRELHDEVGQSLSAVLVELRNLSAGLERPIRGTVAQPCGNRQGPGGKHGSRGSQYGFAAAALHAGRPGADSSPEMAGPGVAKRTSMDVSVATELDSDDLPDEYKTCIYRVVQEALHNCARHSHATTVRIRVEQKPDRLMLVIQDDGQGFDVRQMKGLGLLGIQERVARLGGKSQRSLKAGRRNHPFRGIAVHQGPPEHRHP